MTKNQLFHCNQNGVGHDSVINMHLHAHTHTHARAAGVPPDLPCYRADITAHHHHWSRPAPQKTGRAPPSGPALLSETQRSERNRQKDKIPDRYTHYWPSGSELWTEERCSSSKRLSELCEVSESRFSWSEPGCSISGSRQARSSLWKNKGGDWLKDVTPGM